MEIFLHLAVRSLTFCSERSLDWGKKSHNECIDWYEFLKCLWLCGDVTEEEKQYKRPHTWRCIWMKRTEYKGWLFRWVCAMRISFDIFWQMVSIESNHFSSVFFYILRVQEINRHSTQSVGENYQMKIILNLAHYSNSNVQPFPLGKQNRLAHNHFGHWKFIDLSTGGIHNCQRMGHWLWPAFFFCQYIQWHAHNYEVCSSIIIIAYFNVLMLLLDENCICFSES